MFISGHFKFAFSIHKKGYLIIIIQLLFHYYSIIILLLQREFHII